MSERKRRFLTVLPALAGMMAAAALVIPASDEVRGVVMGACIGVGIASLVKLRRARRC